MTATGEIIAGKYRLLRKLDEGGMGAVYEAEHLTIGGRVAIKLLNSDHSHDASAILRFQREAQAATKVGHEVIVNIHDYGQLETEQPYLVMELLEGQTLRKRLSIEPQLELSFTAYIGCQVLSALASVHHHRIIHRDLKPENIFLVESGAVLPTIKLLDFGISRMIDSSRPTDAAVTRLTRTGTLLGTPEYMSPEQARGQRDIDHRTDLYAMGLILYECVTGHTVYKGSNYNEILARILTEDPSPPSLYREDLPPAFETTLLKALARSPAQRHQSAVEIFRELLPYIDEKVSGRIILPTGVTQDDLDDSGVTDRYQRLPKTAVALEPLNDALEIDTLRSIESPDRRTRRWSLIALLIGVVSSVAIAVAIVLLVRIAEPIAALELQRGLLGDAGALQDPPATGGGASEPLPHEVVLVRLTGLPEQAKVYLDDALTEELPLKLVRGAAMVELRVEAAGYQPFRRVVGTTRERTIEVELEPEQTTTAATGGAPEPARPIRSNKVRRFVKSTSSQRPDTQEHPPAAGQETDYRPREW